MVAALTSHWCNPPIAVHIPPLIPNFGPYLASMPNFDGYVQPFSNPSIAIAENSGGLDFNFDLLFTNEYASLPASDNSMSSLGEFSSVSHDDMLFDFDIFTEQASDPVLGSQFAAGPSSPQLPPLPMPSPPSPAPVPVPIPSSTKPTRKRKSNEVDPANVIHTARPRKAPKRDDEI
ncbi:hypothetical protein MVEN_00678700 [Mycena venus]|uniref:Uncharacterized protein n=1 Tax=Mycena venus TaxID=2733690 RepID=A0A8H6YR31_9AGAR|nr:hypothetical protein MVEN_00678700 [Mycena venus]